MIGNDIVSLLQDAKLGFESKNELPFNRLVASLAEDRNWWVVNSKRKIPSLPADLLDGAYMETLWLFTLGYEPSKFARIDDLVKYFRGMLRKKRGDIAREELPHAINNQSLDAIVERDAFGNDDNRIFGRRQQDSSAETAYFEEVATQEELNNFLATNESIGDYEKAILLSMAEHELSLNDVIDMCELDGMYKNKQALWRAAKKNLNVEDYNNANS